MCTFMHAIIIQGTSISNWYIKLNLINVIHMMHSIEWIGENWMREFNFGTCLNPRAQRVGFRLFPKLNECIQFHWSTKYACASYVL